ncbi:MAG: hypothetical protein AB7F35_07900 [Acetobacteraceae bacterium]
MMKRCWGGLLLGFGLLAGCAEQGPAYPPVPPLMVETMPKPPVSAEPLVWQPGHWNWTGNAYVWAPGQYVPAAGHGPNWRPGYWGRTGSEWKWNPPHWTS